jgi:hypothetical protein
VAESGLRSQAYVDENRRVYAYRATIEPALRKSHLAKVEFLGVIYDYVGRESVELRTARTAHAKLGDAAILARCPLEQLEHERVLRRRNAATRILSQLLQLFTVVAPRPSSRSFLNRVHAIASSIPHCDSAAAAHNFKLIDAAYHALPPSGLLFPEPILSEVELLAYVNCPWQHDRLAFPWATVFEAWIIPLPPAVAAAAAPAAQESEKDHYA